MHTKSHWVELLPNRTSAPAWTSKTRLKSTVTESHFDSPNAPLRYCLNHSSVSCELHTCEPGYISKKPSSLRSGLSSGRNIITSPHSLSLGVPITKTCDSLGGLVGGLIGGLVDFVAHNPRFQKIPVWGFCDVDKLMTSAVSYCPKQILSWYPLPPLNSCICEPKWRTESRGSAIW